VHDLTTFITLKAADVLIDIALGRVTPEEGKLRAQQWANDAARASGRPIPFPQAS
jgi:hypothetical protein